MAPRGRAQLATVLYTFSKGHNLRHLKILWAMFLLTFTEHIWRIGEVYFLLFFLNFNLLPHQSNQFLSTRLTINSYIDYLYLRKSLRPTNVTMISRVLDIIKCFQFGTYWHITYIPLGFGRHKTINSCWSYHVDHTHFTAESNWLSNMTSLQ